MPSPRKNETEHDYIQRAIRYMIEKEGLTAQHAAGKAYGLWKEHKKKKG